MTAPTLLIAALQDEMKAVASQLREEHRAIALVTGMGGARMSSAVEQAIAAHRPARIILLGFSGGLSPAHPAGAVLRIAVVKNEAGQAFQLSEGAPQPCSTADLPDSLITLLTVDHVVTTIAEKERLYAQHRAHAIDMESFHIAKLAGDRNMPLAIIRAISDPHDFALPPQIGDWVNPDGSPRVSAVMRSLAWKPSLLPTLLKLQSHTKTAASNLAAAVMEMV